MKRVTIKDVAREADVSIATVSAVINGRDTVRTETRERVQRTIDRLKYRPVEAARRRLKVPRQKTIGMVVKEVENPFFADVILGAEEEAEEHGFRLLVMSSAHAIGQEIDSVRVLSSLDVHGLIIFPLLADRENPHLDALWQRNIPLVLLEGLEGRFPTAVVDVDSIKAAADVTKHLIDLGHTHIAHLGGPDYSMHAAERIEGFIAGLNAAGLSVDEEDVVNAGAGLADGYRSALHMYSRAPGRTPTALVCYNDLVAIGAMRALSELSLRVPEDVSVVGYDDIRVAEYLPTPLTTVRVPKFELGHKAASLIIEQVEGRADATRHRTRLDAELVIRGTTQPPPQES